MSLYPDLPQYMNLNFITSITYYSPLMKYTSTVGVSSLYIYILLQWSCIHYSQCMFPVHWVKLM